MEIVTISTADNLGGAGRATYRLHQGLKRIGVSNKMIVQVKNSDDADVTGPKNNLQKIQSYLNPYFDLLFLKFYTSRQKTTFSTAWFPSFGVRKANNIYHDIIHLHWISSGFIRIEEITKFTKPIIWTLHDMWAFTGGCHYTGGCDRYQSSCGRCPQLGSTKLYDLSYINWKRKKKIFQKINFTVVADSEWLAECAMKSSLLRNTDVRVIHYGLDTDTYRLTDKHIAREILSLPKNKKIVLFGALRSTTDKRKGYDYLLKAIKALSLGQKAEIVIFGAGEPSNPPAFGMKSHFVGHLSDDISLALLYAAADVMVVPSIQEAFGQTAMEAMACGTPVVAFNIGGLVDQIDHKKNGYLANERDAEDLTRGIEWILSNGKRYNDLSRMARKKVESKFTLYNQAEAYKDLYKEVLKVS